MAIWYFGQGGASGNTGQSFAQRKALHSQLTLASGDTVYICAGAAGAANAWSMTERLLLPTSGVTYHVFTDHYIVVNATSPATNDAAIEASGKSNITIEPGDGFLQLGNPAGWQPNHTLGFNIYSGGGYTCDRQYYFAGCTNIRLIGRWTGTWPDDTAVSNFKVFGGRRYLFAQFDQNCDLCMVDSLDIQKHGTNNDGGAAAPGFPQDWGNGPVFAGARVYVRRSRLKLLGHAGYSAARGFVMDDCVTDGDWTGYSINDDAGRGAPIERSGNRCFSMTSSSIDNDDNGGGLAPYGPALMQNTILKNSGSSGDDPDNAQTELYSQHVICRFNYFWDGCNDAFRASTYNRDGVVGYPIPGGSVNYIKCYNNLIYGNGGAFQFLNAADPQVVNCYKQVDVFNNIFDALKGTYWGSYGRLPGGTYDFAPVRWNPGPDAEGFPNSFKGGRFAGNLIKNASTTASTSSDGPVFYIDVRGHISTVNDGGVYTLSQVQSSFPSNWYNNVNASPTYAGNPASGARTKATFAPNGGLAVGNAEPVAIANNSGPGTTLSVQSGQSRCLFDGWDMESFGLAGDWIVIKNASTGVFGAPVQIATNGIDYPNDDIVLTASRPWNSGDKVYLCLTPDGVNFTTVADIGAGQTAGATIPATGVAGYEVAKGLSDAGVIRPGTFEWFDVGNTLTHTFTGLLPNQEYYFRVRAYDDAGNFSDPSAPRLYVTTNP